MTPSLMDKLFALDIINSYNYMENLALQGLGNLSGG